MAEQLKIVIAGDTHLGGGRVKKKALNQRVDLLFGSFLSVIREADFAITNLESPIVDEAIPVSKIGPNLKSSFKSLPVLKKAGFDLVTLANNHIMDYGEEGLFSTLKYCEEVGINTVGAGASLELAQKPYLYEAKGTKIAIVNIAENEFGQSTKNSAGFHPMDPISNYYAIKSARDLADLVIVIVHGGHEHYELPSPRMKKTYRFFTDVGADAIVGHHTHCVSGYEVYNGVPIIYSLGNFLFDKSASNGVHSSLKWNEGAILELFLNNGTIDFNLTPVIQNREQVGLQPLTSEEKAAFEQKMERINQTIESDEELEQKFAEYSQRESRRYNSYIEPYSVGFLHSMRHRNLFPSLLSDRKKRLLLNITRCEAHRDLLIKTLEL